MASTDPVLWQLALSIQTLLQRISIANGFRTDIGQSVLLEDTQTPDDAAFLPIVITIDESQRSSAPGVNKRQRTAQFTIEAGVSASIADANYKAHLVLADLEMAFDRQAPNVPNVIFGIALTSKILRRPEGLAAVIVQVSGTANYLPQ